MHLCLLKAVSDSAAGKEDDNDMIDNALKQLARTAIARRSRRAARKESRRQLRAELKAVHHELRAERKNERKLKGKDPIIARRDDVLNERKRERKAVRRALRAERKTGRERERERKAVRLALRAERKAERVGRQPDVNCEQSEKKAGRGAAPLAPTHYTPFVPARVQNIAHGKCAATCLACATAEKAATNDEMEFPDYDADPVPCPAVRNTAQLRVLQDSLHSSCMLTEQQGLSLALQRKRGPRRRADGSKREPRQWCADYPALQV